MVVNVWSDVDARRWRDVMTAEWQGVAGSMADNCWSRGFVRGNVDRRYLAAWLYALLTTIRKSACFELEHSFNKLEVCLPM